MDDLSAILRPGQVENDWNKGDLILMEYIVWKNTLRWVILLTFYNEINIYVGVLSFFLLIYIKYHVSCDIKWKQKDLQFAHFSLTSLDEYDEIFIMYNSFIFHFTKQWKLSLYMSKDGLLMFGTSKIFYVKKNLSKSQRSLSAQLAIPCNRLLLFGWLSMNWVVFVVLVRTVRFFDR